MLMYLAANICADIAYAVHQAARFANISKNSNARQLYTDVTFKLSCYVDLDLIGLFGLEDHANLVSLQSITGYLIKLEMCQSHGFSNSKLKFLFVQLRQNVLLCLNQCKTL